MEEEASRSAAATNPGSQLTRWPPPDKREGSAVDPGKRRSLAATPSSPLPCTLIALGLGLGLRHEKEANELMEDLFETFQDEMGFSNMEDDGPEEEERVAEPQPNFNTPQVLRFEELLANLLNEQHQIAKELFEQLKMKKPSAKQQKEVEKVKPQCKEVHQTLILDPAQRKRLQQQMQQHVQLLTQIHLLATCNPNLNPEASSTRICLFYKKTKQLPVLGKCCEEIQPHQWKPPIEREEHRLPFWLKASLPSIQEELRHMADGAREVGNMTGTTEINSDQGLEKDNSELGSETRYPLLLPKGVVLKLKPVADRFPKKAWRQKRSSVLKPLLIQPSPSLQPSFNPGKTPAQSIHSEAPPSKMVLRIPHPIQPATVLQTVPGVPPLGVSGGESFESPAALPAMPPEARTSFPLSESQTLLSSAPVPKVMMPSPASSMFRKPYVRRRPSKRRGARAFRCIKPAPVIHPASVIFTVPATTVKIVSLGGGCNMIQPVNAAVAQSPQTIPIATLLVNPTSFPCPLNQPLVASSVSPLIVSGNSVNLPIPSTPEDKAHVNVDIACAVADGENAFQGLEPKLEPQELSPLSATVFPKVEHSPGPPPVDKQCQEGLSENSAYHWTVVKTEEGRQALEPLPQGIQESLNNPTPGDLEEVVKMEPEDATEEISGFP
nr:YY1-associated protein 1 isoform X9 [Pan troglodytes]